MIEKRKVVLVGTGFVGMSMAYAIEIQGIVNEMVLIDIDKEKAEGVAVMKKKLCLALALVMLLPAVAGLAGLGWFIWGMSSAGLI